MSSSVGELPKSALLPYIAAQLLGAMLGAWLANAMFDLPGFIKSRLERAEIAGVEDLGLCTYAEPARFFSYRRTTHRGEPDYGRHVNAIALSL